VELYVYSSFSILENSLRQPTIKIKNPIVTNADKIITSRFSISTLKIKDYYKKQNSGAPQSNEDCFEGIVQDYEIVFRYCNQAQYNYKES
jgi:hypothetical protein